MAWLEFQTASGGAVLRRQLFTANGTWTKPSGIIGEQVWVTMIGGGSSGNTAGNVVGGTSGAYIARFPVDISGTSSETVTIGAGGAAVPDDNTEAAGNAGSVSSFGAIVSLAGGLVPATDGTYTGTFTTQNPGAGSADSPISPIPSTLGAPIASSLGLYGDGGSGLLLDASGTKAGDAIGGSPLGVGGIGYGAGGSGSYRIYGSGAGADGAILVEWLESV
jgi:hypothetical protein